MRQSGIDPTFQLTAKYEPAEPRSDKEQADLAVQYSVAGLPLEAILRLALGLDDAEIAKVMASAQALVPQLADQIEAGAMDTEDEEGAGAA